MALVMCLSLLPTTAMAAETTTGDSVSASEKNPNGPKIDKIVSWDGNGGYDIRMDAYVTGTVKTETTSTPTDIVLVLDQSGSMKNAISGNPTYEYRYKKADKDAWTGYDFYDHAPTYYHKTNDNEYCKVSLDKTFNYDTYNYNWFLKCECGNIKVPVTKWDSILYTGDLYTQESIITNSRQAAMQDAVKAFINKTAEKNATITESSKQHQIAIVTFAGSSTIRNHLTTVNAEGQTALLNSIDTLGTPSGATNTGAGMANAKTELGTPAEGRAQVVILFTDGTPTTSNDFNGMVAEDAIESAREMKAAGVTVYTISVLDSAKTDVTSGTEATCDSDGDNSDSDSALMNTFMNAVSSNYKSARATCEVTKTGWLDRPKEYAYNVALGEGTTSTGFYKKATSSTELEDIFDDISDSIANPSLPVGKESVLYDTMSNFFTLPANASVADVKVWKVPATTFTTTGEGEAKTTTFTFDESVLNGDPNMQVVAWSDSTENLLDNQVMVRITEGGKVEVKGFDYSSVGKNGNCVLPAPTDSQADKATGYKLVV